MSEIKAGDVVVCVDVSAHPEKNAPAALLLRLGATYRVSRMRLNKRDKPVVYLVGQGPRIYRTWRFRKIEAPRTELAERIMACRPITAPSHA